MTRKEDLYVRATFRLQHCSECHAPFAPEKSVALAAELLALHQSNPALVETLRAQANVCPACKRRAALEHRGSTNVHYYIEEQA